MGQGILAGFIVILIMVSIGSVSVFKIGEYIFSSDEVKVSSPLKYEIELTVDNNEIDTLYVYKIP